VESRGGGKSDHRTWAGVEHVTHQLIPALGVAPYDFEQAEPGTSPTATLDIVSDVPIRVPGRARLTNAEDAVRNGTFRVGLEHSSTMADQPDLLRRACV
jgi:hypothetical protein